MLPTNTNADNAGNQTITGIKRTREEFDRDGSGQVSSSDNNQTSTHSDTASLKSSSNSNHSVSDDQKRARMEAWKKKMAEKGIKEKLQKQREKLAKQQQQQQQQQNDGKKESSHVVNGVGTVAAPTPKIEIKFGMKGAPSSSAPTAAAPAPAATHSLFNIDASKSPMADGSKTKEAEEKEEEEELDPLDAYMKEIEREVAQVLPQRQTVRSVTLEELMKETAEASQSGTDETQDGNVGEDESFHKQFVEALKNQGGSTERKLIEINEQKAEMAANTSGTASSSSTRRRDMLLLNDDMEEDLSAEAQRASRQAELAKASSNKKDLKMVDHSAVNYESFRKDFFIIPKELASLSRAEIQQLRLEYDDIKVRGRACPPPIRNWFQCGLNDTILRVIQENKFDNPFPIQAQAIPVIMSGRDMIGIAKTGSGKTLAFVIPMLRHVLDQRDVHEGEGPIGLIIAPTRELAVQIFSDLRMFARPLGLRCVCAYGGAPIKDQIRQLKGGSHIVVCTPGRMIDLLCANRGRVVNLQRVTYVVLDEADRMFDMGFGPQVTRIVGNVRPDHQIVLFSATFPKPLEALAKRVLKNPIEILVGGRSVSADTVEQHIKVIKEDDKFLYLLELLGLWYERGLILIFVDKQSEVGELFKDLTAAGYTQVLTLHGGMDQIDRDDTLRSFKKKEKNILIATSIASRGLDVKDLQLVINYNVPDHYEDYVHRVGRTGRAGNKGTAYTFITPDEERYAPSMVQALKLSKQTIPEDLQKMADEFMEKRKQGLVEHAPSAMSGYKTQGYKFDASEENKKKEEIKRQMRALGMDDEIEDEEEIAAGEEEPVEEKKSMFLSGIRKVSKTTPAVAGAIAKPSTAVSDKLMRARMLAAAISVGVEQQQQAATSLDGEMVDEEQEEEDARYENEIEINDYPQIARWRVTNKDALFEITDSTGANITVRGMHVEAGKPVPLGERKLHLLVESNSRHTVERATLVIEHILEEATLSASNYAAKQQTTRQPGKYKIEFG